MKTHFSHDRMCEHPLYGVFERQAVCTVCGKHFSFSHDELQELLDAKKLIAGGICSDEKIPYPIKKESLKTIRDYYLEQYNKNEEKENIEQLVWEHFCDTKKIDVWDTLEIGMDAIDNSDTKANMFSCFDEASNFEEVAENVNKKNIEVLEEKFKDDTFPSTVIRPVKQYNGHGEMEITEAGRKACVESVVRFSESENNMSIPYPSEKEMDVAVQYFDNTR